MVAQGAISSGLIGNLVSESYPPVAKKKRNLPGNPDPEAEVIALSPNTLMATNRFICEICGKGFQRDQNLQLHRRGHNLPWKLKQRTDKEAVVRKRVYVCPETSCVHHHPSRALGDLTGIKKHFCRKHGEKIYKCHKCSKTYAVHSDWKAHSKTCGTKEYRCDCGSIFSRRHSFLTHRAFCDALAQETARTNAASQFAAYNINLNYHLMGAPFLYGSNMSLDNFSLLKPLFSYNDDALTDQTLPASLSLWMSQGSKAHDAIANTCPNLQEIHQTGSLNSRSLLLGNDPLVSCSNPPSSENFHQLNWVFGNNKMSSEDFITSSSSVQFSKDQGVPSLYSKQHQSTTHKAESAAALLQRAAQIGANSTDPSLLVNFGLNTSNINCTPLTQDGNNYCDLYGSNSLVTCLGSDHDTDTSTNEISTLKQPQTRLAKRRRVENGDGEGGGQTRDFLGVGVEAVCRALSVVDGRMDIMEQKS